MTTRTGAPGKGSATAVDQVSPSLPTYRATVGVGPSARPISREADARLLRVVVDTDLHLPDMFELTFLDMDGTTLGVAGIAIGTVVTVSGPSTPTSRSRTSVRGGRAAPGRLIQGEVTAVEGVLAGMTTHTIVRGYTTDHRLQRATRSRTFLNSTDSDIARQVATQAGLRCGTIVATRTTHPYVGQFNQTDWDFLASRVADIGYEFGVANGLFYFRPASATGGGRGGRGLVGRLAGAASRPVIVDFPETLFGFRPRVTAGNLTPDVEVRVWDPLARYAHSQRASAPAGAGTSPATLGRQFIARRTGLAGAASAASAALGNVTSSVTGAVRGAPLAGGVLGSPLAGMLGMLGTPPSPTAHVVNDHPIAGGTGITTEIPAAAAALGADVASTYAEAEGDTLGNTGILPGIPVEVVGVPPTFAGTWMVSRALHIFDDREHGYRTTFAAHGRQDRSMVGLTSGPHRRRASRPRIDGVVCGVVSNNCDPLKKSRVKVTLPWLSPDFDTDWAPVVQFCAGPRTGSLFLPEVGDEVMLAFEHGDVRRPYVIGGVVNNLTGWNLATAAVGLAGMISTAGTIATAAAGAIPGFGGLVTSGAGSAMSATGSIMNGVAQTPGRIGEIVHRGFMSSTGNALVFEDLPAIGATAASTAAGGLAAQGMSAATSAAKLAGGAAGGLGGAALGGAAVLGGSAMAPQSSAILLGSQTGLHGLGIDTVNAAVSLKSTAIPGVAKSPISRLEVSAPNGAVAVSSGPAGVMVIDGGLMLNQRSTVSMGISTEGILNIEGGVINITGASINLVGVVTVNGFPLLL